MKTASTARQHRSAFFPAPIAVALLMLTGCGGSLGTEPATKAPKPPASASSSESESASGSASVSAQPSTPGSGISAPPSSEPATPTQAPAPETGNFNVELRIMLIPGPGKEPQEYLLQCDGTMPGDASNVPQPEQACALVEESAQALFFTKPDPTLQCTQQFGGPQTATVTGTVDARPVEADFVRSNGCEIDRWEVMEPILGSGGVM